jgi:hypothetical protein
MKHRIFTILGCFLFCAKLARADTITPHQEKRSDGKVNIGGMLHSEKDLEDPRYRAYAEKLAKDVEKMRAKAKEPVDLSNELMFNIISLWPDSSSKYRDAAKIEFLKRPEETKKEILTILDVQIDNDSLIMFFSILPRIAKLYGMDYYMEITKKVLFHPYTIKNDFLLLENGNLIDALAESPYDETETLDKLIEQGRVIKGSDLEKKWRKMLTKSEVNGREHPAHTSAEGKQQGQRSAIDEATNEESNDKRAKLPWIVSSILLTFCLSLFVWVRIKSKKYPAK